MQAHLTHFIFPGTAQRIVRVDFAASTYQPSDLLWLPHASRFANAVNKRCAEHLAGRIAASEALRSHGMNDYIPGIGLHRAPCWPPGFTGSISHTDKIALATVIPDSPGEHCGIGVDIAIIINAYDAQNIADGIVNAAERELLDICGLPFAFALTLAFSAKESLFKALYRHVGYYFDFSAAEITAINAQTLELKLTSRLGPFEKEQCFIARWNSDGEQLTTLIQR
ncbi:enterobactin synthase subunit EntD [Enterobacteriaceae bacterium H20N1]|uniref:Enterobactin synthase component D n=1 Tax=Dryocola boscaweniae TaxID=2925397 RepID=A0A9X2W5X7_9ENTR|nr:enterobactin synthase subunit EntD [Dryocola boscaweniae]MCT4701633.1 enterobactin synthase subunit EntD [Dryocola boscaweniae]MCT4716277.1 enterobactin synthase subunit EntD [Dryocola boscaweniae]MCT4718802.1 enterobactin synthase subunit EntD [Dryocola boscaweniae]